MALGQKPSSIIKSRMKVIYEFLFLLAFGHSQFWEKGVVYWIYKK
jgi:hypothetical protein